MANRLKLTAFVDETGQDSRGRFFLVSVVIAERSSLDQLREQLVELERTTKKGKKKWRRTRPDQRTQYLDGLVPILKEIAPVYWRTFVDSASYPLRTAEATIAAITHRDPARTALLVVVVDGLNWQERNAFARVFRQHQRRWQKLTGARDETDPVIRLADALAGFLRDRHENQPYTHRAWKTLEPLFHEI